MIDNRGLILDCIIFGLQRFGGISNYWARLIEHAKDLPNPKTLIIPNIVQYVEFQNQSEEVYSTRSERLPAKYTRYLRIPAVVPRSILHTSYYRLPSSKVDRYVVSVYDFTYERYRSGVARFIHHAQKIASLRAADAILCISQSTRRDVLEFCPGIDPAKLHVTHLGVDNSTFFPESMATVDARTTVLFVGQRQGYKRFDLAVQAVRQCPGLSLGIVGPRLSDEERVELARALGPRWREFGSVGSHELRRLYCQAFAFIFPSDYEGFGLPLLEAMACGCPVVAAGRSSLPEIGAGAARYAQEQRADCYAHELAALTDAAHWQVAAQAGLVRAAEFSWSQTFDRTFAVYAGQAASNATLEDVP